MSIINVVFYYFFIFVEYPNSNDGINLIKYYVIFEQKKEKGKNTKSIKNINFEIKSCTGWITRVYYVCIPFFFAKRKLPYFKVFYITTLIFFSFSIFLSVLWTFLRKLYK